VADLPERVDRIEQPNAAAVFSVILETLVERHEERVVVGGAANLASADFFSQGLREVLEALEEQVVLIRLLGESDNQAAITVRIGAENQVEGLQSTSLVAAGYGSGEQALARLGVIGPTRMDYPTAMGAVRAVARYVGQILAGA
jgi:heat-inducible transcriptional repressor